MNYVGRRLLHLFLVLLAATFLSYISISLLPGDTVDVICATSCDGPQRAELRKELGLDRPVFVRYFDWISSVAVGDLGESQITKQPISDALRERFPVTLELLIFSQFLSLGIAIPLGMLQARYRDSFFDQASGAVAAILLAIPPFISAPLLTKWFAVEFDWFPAVGYTNLTEDLFENIRSFFLPAFAIALGEIAVYSRLLRTDMVQTLQEDYIMMAKAKGLSNRRILLRHAFRPSTFSLLTVAGLRIAALIGGAFVVEYFFTLNGLGSYAIQSIGKRDYLALQGTMVVIVMGFVIINFAVDMLYAVLDPRIRHARAES